MHLCLCLHLYLYLYLYFQVCGVLRALVWSLQGPCPHLGRSGNGAEGQSEGCQGRRHRRNDPLGSLLHSSEFQNKATLSFRTRPRFFRQCLSRFDEQSLARQRPWLVLSAGIPDSQVVSGGQKERLDGAGLPRPSHGELDGRVCLDLLQASPLTAG